MRTTEKAALWVVYRMTVYGKPSGATAVCDQREWDAVDLARPGYHTLLLAGIASEAQAERLARGGPADADTNKPPRRKARRRRAGDANGLGVGSSPTPAAHTPGEACA